jgi:hypothetical protein
MEWLGLVLWAMVVGMALPMSGAGALTAPSLGTASALAIAGLVLCVLYIALDGGRWMAWASFGVAVAGAVCVARAAQVLVSDEPRVSTAGQAAEETAAVLAGFLVPLMVTVAFVMICAAAGITTVD